MTTVTTYVLDLSNNNGSFDAAQVKQAGYAGVILKATEGTNFVDATFRPRAEAAHSAGLVVGAYAFCHPSQDATQQAQLFADTVAGAGVPVPFRCADIEVQEGNVDAFASTFCPLAQVNVLYSGAYFSSQITTPIPGVDWWLAAYGPNRPAPPWGEEAGWQFTDSANVPGVGACDESVFDDAVWARLTGQPQNATVDQLLSVAAGQVGYEGTDNEGSKFGDWYGLPNEPWCAMFVSWCFDQVGMSAPRFAYCPTGVDQFKAYGLFDKTPRRGDVVFYDWNADGVASHTGLVERVDADGTVHTIEGNRELPNDPDGVQNPEVARHTIPGEAGWDVVLGFGHPLYGQAPAVVAAPSSSSEGNLLLWL